MAIVCGTDFSDDARRAARASLGLAGPSGEEVLLVHAMELPTIAFVAGEGIVMPPAAPPPDTTEIRRELDVKLADEARGLGGRVRPVLTIGAPEIALIDEVRRYDARMLVVGSHGTRGAARFLLGSTADRLARSSPVPLLVVRGEADRFVAWAQTGQPLRVLVCVDFEEATEAVVGAAVSLCRGGACELHFAHSFERPTSPFTVRGPAHPATQWAELEHLVGEELERIAERHRASPDRIHLVRGKPASALSQLARDEAFDLIVVGTHGRHGLDRLLLGSVAVGLLHRAPCPVLIAPIGPLATHAEPPRPEVDPSAPAVPPPFE